MADYKYFVADPLGITHTVFANMEEAGSKILSAFQTIDQSSRDLTPGILSFDGKIMGVFLMPNFEVRGVSRDYMLSTMAQGLEKTLAQENFDVLVLVPPIEVLRERAVKPLNTGIARSFTALQSIKQPLANLGLEPNVAIRISKMAAYNEVFQPSKPDAAVVSSEGQTLYPDSRIVYHSWVMRCPQQANGYTPPAAREITANELNDLTKGFDFDIFRHNHELARNRILSLQGYEIEYKS